jgi:hypothetical protein
MSGMSMENRVTDEWVQAHLDEDHFCLNSITFTPAFEAAFSMSGIDNDPGS